METDARYPVRPCLQGGRETLVLGLHLQEGYHSTPIFLLFYDTCLQGRQGYPSTRVTLPGCKGYPSKRVILPAL